MTLKVGLLIGREWSFPPVFIEEVNRRNEDVVAELVKLGGTRMDEPCPYAVIIDRISHEIPYYRLYLKYAVLQGATVINNPFMWTADDKFFEAALATKLGVASPKTLVLPNKDYVPGIVHDESLRNLVYPLDWQGIIDYVGLPCVLKDALGGGGKDVFVCHTIGELLYHYDQFGLKTVIVLEFMEWQQYIRCVCLGQEDVLPIKYDPHERKYHVEHQHLSPELGQRVVDDSLKLVRALGYEGRGDFIVGTRRGTAKWTCIKRSCIPVTSFSTRLGRNLASTASPITRCNWAWDARQELISPRKMSA